MTAVRSPITLNTLARNAEIMSFINEHGDKLGQISTIVANEPVLSTAVSGNAQIDSDERDPAGALITWFYLLDASRVVAVAHGNETQVYVRGELAGNEFWAYGRFRDADAAYLQGVAEPSVHALRRIQIGDVPEVVAA